MIFRKALALAFLLPISAIADEVKTYTLTEAQAADYARRLQAEVQQITQQYQADIATLKAMQDQVPPAKAPEEKKEPK